jgi:hypothetical protein
MIPDGHPLWSLGSDEFQDIARDIHDTELTDDELYKAAEDFVESIPSELYEASVKYVLSRRK